MLQQRDPEKYAKDKEKGNKRLAKILEEQVQENKESKKQRIGEKPTGPGDATQWQRTGTRVNAAGGVEQQGGASASGHAVNPTANQKRAEKKMTQVIRGISQKSPHQRSHLRKITAWT